MASIVINGPPEDPAAPAADPWLDSNDPISIQADEMFVRQLDTGFAGEIRTLVHDPETGLAGKEPEDALGGVAEAMPLLGELKDRYLSQTIGPRQRSILEPLIDSRLDRAAGELGRIAQQATSALDDRIVAERLADLHQDAALAWRDPAHLRALGRTAVGELRYQGERKGWDATQTDTNVRQSLSDLYAGAVEQAIGQDPVGAANLYEHARDVIQPERQAVVERKIERVREERRVTDILGGRAATPDDPTRRPDFDDYQARAAELTPPDASAEVRAQVNRMVRIEHAQADRTWQAARGRAAVAAVDWLGKNPAARLLAMPSELRDGLSPEQTEALDAAAINGGRFVTDRDLYEALDGQAVQEPEAFAGIDLAQHRLSLGDRDYQRLVGFQQAIVEGRSDAAFERHSLGRVFLDEGLRKVNFDPDGPAARTARRQLDRLLGAFEAVEGKPPMMADIRGLVADVLLPLADDQNIVRISGDDPAGVDSDTQVAQQEPVDPRRGLAPNVEPIPGNPEHEAARLLVPNKEVDGPIAGLRHYMSGSGETVEFRFDNIDTSLVKPSQFPTIKAILDRGEPGQFPVQGKMPFSTKNRDAEHFVGNITLNIKGTLLLDEDGKHSFDGELGAEPDRYRFYPSTHRGTFAELLTRLGTLIPGREYAVVIPGRKAISGDGKYRD